MYKSGKYISGKLQQAILKEVARALFRPAHLYEMYPGTNRYNLKKTLDNLQRRGLIRLGGEAIKLTEKGQRALENIEVREIKIKKRVWQGQWSFVSYDIPNIFKNERNYLISKLKTEGFHKVHDSLWALPFECKEEIAIFCHHLKISPFVIFLKSDYLPNQEKILKKYGIT